MNDEEYLANIKEFGERRANLLKETDNYLKNLEIIRSKREPLPITFKEKIKIVFGIKVSPRYRDLMLEEIEMAYKKAKE